MVYSVSHHGETLANSSEVRHYSKVIKAVIFFKSLPNAFYSTSSFC